LDSFERCLVFRKVMTFFSQAFRRCRRTPVASLLVAATVAAGTAISAILFSLLYPIALARLPFPDGDRMFVIADRRVDSGEVVGVAPGRYKDILSRLSPVASIGAAWPGLALNARAGRSTLRVSAAQVDSVFLSLFGPIEIGRGFNSGDLLPDSPPAVLMSDGLWHSRFGADPSIVGQLLMLDGIPHEIIGVTPAGLVTPAGEVDVWLPLRLTVWNRVSRNLLVVGRLKAGTTADDMRRLIASAQTAAATAYPDTDGNIVAFARDVRSVLGGETGPSLWLIFAGSATLVCLIALNLSTLFLARITARRRDIAIHRALGARKRDVVTAELAEGAVLVATGCFAGLVLARIGLPAISSLAASVSRSPLLTESITFSWPAFSVAAIVAVFVTVVATAAPAVVAANVTPFEILRTRSASASVRLRRPLIIGEIAGATVLLVMAVLVARTALSLANTDPGFRSTNVLTARLSLPATTHGTGQIRRETAERIIHAIDAMPGVERTAIGSALPFGGAPAPFNFYPDVGRPRQQAQHRSVSPLYFSALGIKFLAGRDFNPDDRADAPLVAIVSVRLASRWNVTRPDALLGRRLSIDGPAGPWREIVGVVSDTRYSSLHQDGLGELYLPWTQDPWPQLVLIIRHKAGLSPPPSELSRAINTFDTDLPLFDITPLAARLLASYDLERLLGRGFIAFAALALGLALVGTYALLSWIVETRQTEFGVRLALGAPPGRMRESVGLEAVRLLAAGLAFGVPLSIGAGRLISLVTSNILPLDGRTLFSGVLLVSAGTLVAALRPVWRSGSIDPAVALRSE
jgi:putative ABC transport system permease protein